MPVDYRGPQKKAWEVSVELIRVSEEAVIQKSKVAAKSLCQFNSLIQNAE